MTSQLEEKVMEWLNQSGEWMRWLWAWMDWGWAAAWILAGILATHLVWWRRGARLADREKKIDQCLAAIDNRQQELRRLSDDLSRRESSLRKMEENLKTQTEQLKPQIDQVRDWLDRVLRDAGMGDGGAGCRPEAPAARPKGASPPPH